MKIKYLFQFRSMGILGLAIVFAAQPKIARSDQEQTQSKTVFKPYGFINADVTGTSGALDSFGNTNLSAPTTSSPSSVSDANRARDSFQVAQSRLGIMAEHGEVGGRIEVDFIDFTKATPITQ